MTRLTTILLALALAPSAHAAAKAGVVAPPPTGASAAALATLDGHDEALVELDRARGTLAEPLLRRAGGELVSRELMLWKLPSAAVRRLAPRLQREGRVRRVEPNVVHFRSPFRSPFLSHIAGGDELLHLQWWLAAVGADRAEPPGPGRPVTVIDSGIEAAHPEFAGRPDTILLNTQSLETASPGNIHGTAVASLVAAPANGSGTVGVYPRAVLQSWDVSPGNRIDLASVVQGILSASARGAGVINVSIGFEAPLPALQQAIHVALRRGSVVVAAAGNDQQSGNMLLYPANETHVLTVAATARDDTPAPFSSSSPAVDVAAPGTDIPAAIPSRLNPTLPFDLVEGTSFAAPIVSGATAWVWTARPELHATQVFDLMRRSARDVADRGFDQATGFGILDIPRALAAAPPPVDPQEPNDDVDHVRANGLFRDPTPPLTRPGSGGTTLRARLDATEDPEDVYRVYVPPLRRVTATVTGDGTVSVDLWRTSVPSVRVEGALRRRHLLAASARPGRTAEVVTFTNVGKRGVFVYLDVFLPRAGTRAASYSARIATTAPPPPRR